MSRLRRLGYSAAVGITVFALLSIPVLGQLYGPVVYLPVYALVAFVAGGVTWALLRRISTADERVQEAIEIEQGRSRDNAEEVDVDAEIDQLKAEE